MLSSFIKWISDLWDTNFFRFVDYTSENTYRSVTTQSFEWQIHQRNIKRLQLKKNKLLVLLTVKFKNLTRVFYCVLIKVLLAVFCSGSDWSGTHAEVYFIFHIGSFIVCTELRCRHGCSCWPENSEECSGLVDNFSPLSWGFYSPSRWLRDPAEQNIPEVSWRCPRPDCPHRLVNLPVLDQHLLFRRRLVCQD